MNHKIHFPYNFSRYYFYTSKSKKKKKGKKYMPRYTFILVTCKLIKNRHHLLYFLPHICRMTREKKMENYKGSEAKYKIEQTRVRIFYCPLGYREGNKLFFYFFTYCCICIAITKKKFKSNKISLTF